MVYLRAALVILTSASLFAQAETSGEPKQRIRAVRDLGKQGSESIVRIQPYLRDPEANVRVEAVKAIVEIGTQRSLEPLVEATRDNDPEVQIRATDGLVNFYLPGYVKTGMSASVKRVGTAISGRFTDTNDQVIDPYVNVRPEIIQSLGKLVSGGGSMQARANAARAVGILRGTAALDDLVSGVRSKDDQLIYESLIAIQKIRDASVAPRIFSRLHDLNERVQVAAIETVGLLRDRSASPDLREVVEKGRTPKVRRAALASLAQLPDDSNRATYSKYLSDKDDGMRAAAAEGIGRLRQPDDMKRMSEAFDAESKMSPRLSMAFAVVLLGRNELSEFSPLQYLVNTLNSKLYKGVAQPFLEELARDPGVRRTLYAALKNATRDERIGLAQVFARSGDTESVQYVERIAADPDADVAREGMRALKSLRARQ